MQFVDEIIEAVNFGVDWMVYTGNPVEIVSSLVQSVLTHIDVLFLCSLYHKEYFLIITILFVQNYLILSHINAPIAVSYYKYLGSALAIRLYVQNDTSSYDTVYRYDLIYRDSEQFVFVKFPTRFMECFMWTEVMEAPHKSVSTTK